MKRKTSFLLISIILIVGLLLNACGAQAPTEQPVSTELPQVLDATGIQVKPDLLDRAIILSPNIKLLNPDVIAQMKPAMENYRNEPLTATVLDETGGGIRISKADLSDVQFQFQPGQIISAGITEETPLGLLRKVVSVQEIDTNSIKLVTEQATLEEAIQDGAFTVNYSNEIASSTGPVANYPVNGGGVLMPVALKSAAAPLEIPIKIDAVLYDDGMGGKVKANGDIKVTPDFDLTVMITGSEMDKFAFVDKTDVEAVVTITSGVEFPIKNIIQVYDQYLPKIWFEVAGLPVVIAPKLIVSIGLDGKVSAGITMRATYKNTITLDAGWTKESGEWELINDFNSDPVITYSPPAFKTKFSAKVIAQPRLELMLYGVIGPYAQMDAYFKYDADPKGNPWWTLKAGVDAEIGITSFKLFGFIKIYPFAPHPYNLYLIDIDHAPLEPLPGDGDESPQETEAVTEAPPVETEIVTENPPIETEEPSPPISGNGNFLLVYDSISATLINISQESISVEGIEFKRINNQGSTTASFLSDTWRGYTSGGYFDALPPNDCLTINTKRSSRPSTCEDTWGFFTTSQAQYQFWLATSDSRQFQVWQNGTLLQICEISAGSCSFSATAGNINSSTRPDTPPNPQPQPAGNENMLIFYDDISANLINISQNNVSLGGIEFRRIDDQGSTTASFLSDTWRSFTSNGYFDALPPNDCLRINTQRSLRPSGCEDTWGFFTTSQTQYQFWLPTSNSREFQIWRNNNLLQTCVISAGSCRFFLSQP